MHVCVWAILNMNFIMRLSATPRMTVLSRRLKSSSTSGSITGASGFVGSGGGSKIGSSEAGVVVYHLMLYRCILLDTGGLSDGMWPEDFLLFGDWLDELACYDGREAFYASGENVATILQQRCPSFLNNPLGAILVSSSYRDLAMDHGAVARS